MQNGFLGERHPQERARKKVSDCHNQFNRHGQSDGVYVASGGKDNENSSHGALPPPEKCRSQHQRRPDAKCLSPCPVGDRDQKKGELSKSWRIEFGSIGDLAERVISGCADHETRGGTAVMKQER